MNQDATGTIVEIIGAVIDVQFPSGQVPKIYDALRVDDHPLVLEVQQQLGDGVVRTIAMGPSETRLGCSEYRRTDYRAGWETNTRSNYGCTGSPD